MEYSTVLILNDKLFVAFVGSWSPICITCNHNHRPNNFNHCDGSGFHNVLLFPVSHLFKRNIQFAICLANHSCKFNQIHRDMEDDTKQETKK